MALQRALACGREEAARLLLRAEREQSLCWASVWDGVGGDEGEGGAVGASEAGAAAVAVETPAAPSQVPPPSAELQSDLKSLVETAASQVKAMCELEGEAKRIHAERTASATAAAAGSTSRARP